MKGENPDKFRVSTFSLSLLFRYFPAKWQISPFFVDNSKEKAYFCILSPLFLRAFFIFYTFAVERKTYRP